MIVQFNTSSLSEKEAQELLALLSPYATQSLVQSLEKVDAVRRSVRTAEPEYIESTRIYAPEDQAMKAQAPEEHEAPKKRGRPKKEVVEVRPTAVEDADGPTLSDAPTTGNVEPVQSKHASADAPVALDELREAVNDHVSRLGMPSAQAILKKFGCERVTAVMDQAAAKQREILAALQK